VGGGFALAGLYWLEKKRVTPKGRDHVTKIVGLVMFIALIFLAASLGIVWDWER
jgi:hypothetical protein